jgi:hypothetical protein
MAKASTQTKSKPTAAPPPPNKSKAVATTKESTELDVAAQEELLKMMAADSGKGVSTDIADNIVPLVYILQSNSPQVQKKGEGYVQGAEAGMIWFRGSKTVVAGDDGILVVPCHFDKCWIEWQPNRGGFVGRHKDKPPLAEQKTDPANPKKKYWGLPNGNHVVETREHVVIALDAFDRPLPFVIPMSGSGHGASRAWMTLQNQKFVPGTDLKAPSYGFIYRMKLQFRTNDQGDWFMWDIVDGGDNEEPFQLSDPAVYRMARQIEQDFSSGKLKADQMTNDQVDDGDSGQGQNARGQRAAEHI